MISQKTIQEVLDTAKIEDVIGDFITLRRRGINMIGLCPFHDEKTPSFTVSPAKNIYKCFGCGKGGDPVRFIMDHESLSYPEAIRFLAQRYKIEIEETALTEQEKENRNLADSLYIINEFAKNYYQKNLFERQEGKAIGLSYFKERGFREHIIKKFELGYATESRDELTQSAIQKKFNIEYLRKLGITTSSDADFFRSRVIFPFHGISGKIIGFGGRTLSADKKIPKYINSSESEIYNKRNVLYGLYFAKEAIRREDECILVEGYTDVITLHQGEITNVVASSGTSLTNEQIRLIKRYTSNIKIIYDGDPAGIKAALRGLDMILEADMNVKLVLLPESEDPDSYLSSQGTEAFKAYLKKHEEDFVLFKTRILLSDTANDPIKKAGVLRDIVSSVSRIPDQIKRTLYIQQCAAMMDVPEYVLIQETNQVIRAEIKKKKFEGSQENLKTDQDEAEWLRKQVVKPVEASQDKFVWNDFWQEKEIAELLVVFGEKTTELTGETLAAYILRELIDFVDEFDHPLFKKILQECISKTENTTGITTNFFINHEDDEIKKFAVDALSSPYEYASWEKKGMLLQTQKMPEENYHRSSEMAVMRLKLKKIRRTIDKIEKEVASWPEDQINSGEYTIQLKVLLELIRMRNELAATLGTVTL